MSTVKALNDIQRVKTALIKSWKENGPRENFGQSEILTLKDKYNYCMYNYYDKESRQIHHKIDELDDFCLDYTGKE